MSRKPTPKAARAPSPALPGTQLQTAQRAAAAVTSDSIAWLQAAQRGGLIRAHAFHELVAARAMLETYAQVKESKGYVGMPYVDSDGKLRQVATLEEYCREVLGKSYRRCEELLATRHLLGPELYEQAEEIGLGQRDYNAIKALPSKAQDVIKAAIEGKEDRKAVVEKLVKLVEQQQVEKDALATERDKAVNQYEAREAVIEGNTKKISDLKEKLLRIPREKPDEKGKAMILEVAAATQESAVDLKHLVKASDALLQHAVENGLDTAPYKAALTHHMAGVVEQLGELIALLQVTGLDAIIEPIGVIMSREANRA